MKPFNTIFAVLLAVNGLAQETPQPILKTERFDDLRYTAGRPAQ